MKTIILIILLSLQSISFSQTTDIGLSIIGSGYTIIGNSEIFTITVSNNGPIAASDVVVSFSGADCFTNISSTTSIGNFLNNQWNIGNLNVNQEETMTLTSQLINMCSCSYLLYGTISSSTLDNYNFNNTSVGNYEWDISTDLDIYCDLYNSTISNSSSIFLNYKLKNIYNSDACGAEVYFNSINGLTILNANPSIGVWNSQIKTWQPGLVKHNLIESIVLECLVNSVADLSISANIFVSSPWEINLANNSCSTSFSNLFVIKNENYNNIQINPNPVTNILTIDNKSDMPINSISIADINGRNVFETKNVTNSVDVSSLSKGMYFVKIATDLGSTTKKLIKR